MTYIREQTSTERFPDQFKRVGDEVYERKLAQKFEFTEFNTNAVPTYTQFVLSKWEETPLGQFVIEHGVDHFFLREATIENPFLYKMAIVTYMPSKRWTEFYLKFLDNSNR